MGSRPRCSISNPVSQEDEDRGCNDGRFGPSAIQREDDEGRYDDEGEEEGRAEPVDGRLGDPIVLRHRRRVGREGEPLRELFR